MRFQDCPIPSQLSHPLFVEVDQFLVQQTIEHFEILDTFPNIAVPPDPTLPSADVVQHILDLVAAKRLQRAVSEDSVQKVVVQLLISDAHFCCFFRTKISR